MSKHKATKQTTNWKAWRHYVLYLLLTQAIKLTKANNKHKTKHNNNKTQNKTKK